MIGPIGSLDVTTGCTAVTVQPDPGAQGGFDVFLDLGIGQSWTDPEAAADIALRAAQDTCGLSAGTPADAVALTRGPALYNFRGYRFACPIPGEATQ